MKVVIIEIAFRNDNQIPGSNPAGLIKFKRRSKNEEPY